MVLQCVPRSHLSICDHLHAAPVPRSIIMGKCDVCKSPCGHKGQDIMVVLTTTMTVCLGCWHDDLDADYGAILEWVTSDEESEASYDGDPREADHDPLNKRAFTDPHEPDPEPSPDKRQRRAY